MVTADDVIRLCFGLMMINVFAVTKKISNFNYLGFWIIQRCKVLENPETVVSLFNTCG